MEIIPMIEGKNKEYKNNYYVYFVAFVIK